MWNITEVFIKNVNRLNFFYIVLNVSSQQHNKNIQTRPFQSNCINANAHIRLLFQIFFSPCLLPALMSNSI